MAHRLALRDKADLEELALYFFVETGSLEIANRLADSTSARFLLLAAHPSARRTVGGRVDVVGAGACVGSERPL